MADIRASRPKCHFDSYLISFGGILKLQIKKIFDDDDYEESAEIGFYLWLDYFVT